MCPSTLLLQRVQAVMSYLWVLSRQTPFLSPLQRLQGKPEMQQLAKDLTLPSC